RRNERRRKLIAAILDWLDAEDGGSAPPVDARRPLGARVAMDLLQLVRGRDRARLVDLLRRTGTDEALCRRIGSGRASERIEAARALALFSAPETLWALEEGLDDRDPEVRLTVASSLVALQAAPPLTVLIGKLAIGSAEQSRTLAPIFRELAKTRKDEFAAALADPDMPLPALLLVVDALGRTGDYRLVDDLAPLADHPALDVRAQALRALGSLGHPAAASVVLGRLDDAAWQVRAQAAIAAGRIGLAEAAPRLRELLADQVWWMRLRAAQALLALGPVGEGMLTEAAAGSGVAAETAATALAERAQS
ncbi:MAG: HEAT repeat domain-containing protein, partial [Alphaproteobacteria bacterium]